MRRQGVRRYGGGKRSVAVRQQGVAGRLCQTPVPASQLFFKGENGFNMAPSGSRVLIVPPRKKKSGCAENARTAHAMANTGMGTGTEDAHVAANTITIINFFPSGAFS